MSIEAAQNNVDVAIGALAQRLKGRANNANVNDEILLENAEALRRACQARAILERAEDE